MLTQSGVKRLITVNCPREMAIPRFFMQINLQHVAFSTYACCESRTARHCLQCVCSMLCPRQRSTRRCLSSSTSWFIVW